MRKYIIKEANAFQLSFQNVLWFSSLFSIIYHTCPCWRHSCLNHSHCVPASLWKAVFFFLQLCIYSDWGQMKVKTWINKWKSIMNTEASMQGTWSHCHILRFLKNDVNNMLWPLQSHNHINQIDCDVRQRSPPPSLKHQMNEYLLEEGGHSSNTDAILVAQQRHFVLSFLSFNEMNAGTHFFSTVSIPSIYISIIS